MLPYALTIFIGAFLLFQVQPLIAKFILPWFGGSAAVWTASMLFFQVFLLGGYVYAHWSIQRLKPRAQAVLHVALLILALAQLPVAPSDSLQPLPGGDPLWQIVVVLTLSIGLPYLLLAATSPLMQAWFSRTNPGASPYRLYALSNVGSLLALLSYPFVFEPALTRRTQSALWSVGFVAFVVACSLAAAWTWRQRIEEPPPGTKKRVRTLRDDQPRQAIGTRLLQPDHARHRGGALLVGAAPQPVSAGVHHRFRQPALVRPARVYRRPHPGFDRCPVVAVSGRGRAHPAPDWRVLHCDVSVLYGLSGRTQPPTTALGGLFVALLAPLIFVDLFELHTTLWLVAALTLVILFTDHDGALRRGKPRWAWGLLIVALLGMSYGFWLDIDLRRTETIARSRNFYGPLSVLEWSNGRVLRHGAIYHGMQLSDPNYTRVPVTYYSEVSGVALALRTFPRQNRQIGVTGLGIGTVAAFGWEGDTIRFYEIDPAVQDAAQTYFTYLADSRAEIEIVLGDARLSMEQEPPQNYDVLILDAFTGDAVPVHLLTVEAFELYLTHLKPDGLIIVNITNRHLDLEPVVRGLADQAGMETLRILNGSGPGEMWTADWMLVTRNEEILNTPILLEYAAPTGASYDHVRLWTDDYSSLFQVLR
jgi:hypothetical protein